MKAFQVIVVVMLLLFFAFGGGYFLGYYKVRALEKTVEKVQAEARGKIATLEKELAGARAKMALAEVKEKLGQARFDVLEKNYGNASRQIEAAQEALAKANERADEEMRKALGPMGASLSEVRADIDRLDPKVGAKIEALRGRIAEVAAR